MTAKIILSPEGLNKLKTELAERKQLRSEFSDRIAEAKEHGDLSENAEYHQARDDQSFNEGRIREIETLLRDAEVVEKSDSSIVGIGSKIKIRSGEREMEYTIAGATEADPARGLISCESPLGVSFLGKSVGAEVEVKTPTGVNKYKIISIE
ncbi:MAG: transcription elongation factor GreA [Candidatus Komeilibacteria bacterium]